MEFPYPYGGSEDVIAKIEEANTARLRIVIKDPTLSPPVAIPGSSIATAYFSLYDYATRAVINERDRVDVRADITEAGVLTIDLEPADNAIVGGGGDNEELHIALIDCTMVAGSRTVYFRQEIGIIVSDLAFSVTYPIRKTVSTSWHVLSLT